MLRVSCLGGVTLDILVSTDGGAPDLPGQKQDVQSIAMATGGGAMNAASVMRKLGAEVEIHCAIGRDEAAGMILRQLAERGISTEHIEVFDDTPTGKAVVTVSPSGDASVAAARGANQRLSGSTMRAATGELLYIAAAPRSAYSAIAERLSDAPRAFAFVAFNPGIRQIMEAFPLVEALCASSELLLVNKSEALQIAEMRKLPSTGKTIEQICLELNEGRSGSLCITDGAHGSLLASGGTIAFQSAVPLPLRLSHPSTVGAGDAFGATLAYFLANGERRETCLRLAAHNSAATVSRMDASSGALSIDELFARDGGP